MFKVKLEERSFSEGRTIHTIAEIARLIKTNLESNLGYVWITGEASRIQRPKSGHIYFDLKDKAALINAIIWAGVSKRMKILPEEGTEYVVYGKITSYPPRSNYQIQIERIEPKGMGNLHVAFEKLKKKLLEEGLFNQEHKKELPPYPSKIGIITSPTGAAIQDMLNIFSRRFPGLQIFIYPAKVQGDGASIEISNGIEFFNKHSELNIDLLIIGRGGGSIEDLWCFNEENLARAIFASSIPVVSAVGHEIDFTISDMVADLRAPTPSAAAELTVREKNELIQTIDNLELSLNNTVKSTLDYFDEKLNFYFEHPFFKNPATQINRLFDTLNEKERLFNNIINSYISFKRESISSLLGRLKSLDPKQVLKRGYSIVQFEESGEVIASVDQVSTNDTLRTTLKDGIIHSIVLNSEDKKLGGKSNARKKI